LKFSEKLSEKAYYSSVVDLVDPHRFGKTDLDPHQRKKSRIRIWIRIIVKSRIRICINVWQISNTKL
jgi:hypothetical protein